MLAMAQMQALLVLFFAFILHLVPIYSLTSIPPQPANHSPNVIDACDWIGSPNLDSDRSVVNINLRCARGTINWLYPKGGLRITLRLGTHNKNFKGCIRVSRNSTKNVRIYIEGKRQLHQIYSADDGKHPDLFRCFVSVHSFMALFIETDSNSANDVHSQEHIAFSYDLQATNNTTPEGNMDECRPCSPQKILSLFCSADFVVSGKVTYYYHRPEVQMTEFNVKPTFMYRFPVDSSYVNDFNASQYAVHDQENSIEVMNLLSQVNLNRPVKCAAGATPRTEYLFLGRKVLGNYFITCAPRLSDWRQISKKALELGTNQCHII